MRTSLNFLRTKTIHSITKRPINRAAVPRKGHPSIHTLTHTHTFTTAKFKEYQWPKISTNHLWTWCVLCASIHENQRRQHTMQCQDTANAHGGLFRSLRTSLHFTPWDSVLVRSNSKREKKELKVIDISLRQQSSREVSQPFSQSVQFSVIVLVSEVSRVKSQSSVYLFDVAHDRVCEFQLKKNC